MASKNRRLFELRLGKLGLVLFICGMSLLLFSMFILGIVVGKDMEAYPEKYAAGIAELIRDRLSARGGKEGTSPRVQVGQAPGNEKGEADDRFDLTFYDTLAGKKGGAPGDLPAASLKDPPPGAAPKAVPPAGEGASGGGTAVPAPADAQQGRGSRPEGAGTEAKAKPTGKPQALPAPAKPAEAAQGTGRYEIQAAAYREKSKAEQLARRLSTLGFPARVAAKDLPGSGQWYRVIAGGFEDRTKAKDAAEKMAAKVGGLKCVVRPAESGGN